VVYVRKALDYGGSLVGRTVVDDLYLEI